MLLVNAHQLHKSFANKVLFKSINFGIEEKERIGLVGPNGAGKSTLLKIIAGRMEPDSGQMTLKKGLTVGFLDQSPQFEKGHTILESILSKCRDQHESMGDAYEWIAKLELTQFGEDFLVEKLSGGWKKRVALARELVLRPELLLLDEPTNHLDVTHILWLEEYLRTAPYAIFMITHDRLFLQRVVNKVIDLDPKNPNYLLSVDGDYLKYIEVKEQLLAAQATKEQVLKNTLRRETEWLRRGAKARTTKSTARIKSTHALADEVGELQNKNASREIKIDFGENEKNPKKLIEAKNISKTYGKRTLFKNLDLLISPKTRLALMGDNGSGKSTLIKVLLGAETSDTGSVYQAENLKVSYFEQNRETLKPSLSVLKNICPAGDYVSYRGQYMHARSYLDKFLFFQQAADLPVDRLSGGEQARLRIAQLMLQDAQVLVLDEPTNDLDVATLTVLEESLKDFNGAVILVTHDRYFMDSVSNQIMAFHEDPNGNKSLETFANYMQWEEWYEEQIKSAKVSQKTAKLESAAKEKAVPKVKLSFKDKFEYENMEKNIQALEAKLAEKQAESLNPDISTQVTKLMEVHAEMGKIQSELDRLYVRWSELEKMVKGS